MSSAHFYPGQTYKASHVVLALKRLSSIASTGLTSTMTIYVISSPLRRRFSHDIKDLQAEIGREAARAYCTDHLASLCSLTENVSENATENLLAEFCITSEDLAMFPLDRSSYGSL